MSTLPFDIQLENILKQNSQEVIERQCLKFDQLIANTGENYVLFGAGRLGKIVLSGLRKASVYPLAFSDNNPDLWDKSVEGLVVLSPKEAVERYGNTAVFVITVYTSQPVWDQLTALGAKIVSFAELAWKYPLTLIPHADLDLPTKIFDQSDQVRAAFDLWADETSRREYLGQLFWRTSLDRSALPEHLPQQDIYFIEDIIAPSSDDVFVDCGAFDGDSVREIIKRQSSGFKQIIAIEPDHMNCQSLQNSILNFPSDIGNKVIVFQNAVGSHREVVRFNTTGTAASSVGDGMSDVESVPLDELVAGFRPTYIKMDIEGAETDALLGGRTLIREGTPILAICVYHRQEDLWKIPLLIHSFSDQYKLFLRRYADDCWELVCYAVPLNRLKV
jgi:FkbM family methyltransferase